MHMNNLASLYAQQWRLAEAESLYVEALAMSRRLFTSPHEDIARQYNNLGTILRDRNRSEDAREAFAKAVEEYRALDQGVPLGLATALGNLGRMQVILGEKQQGRSALQEALEIRSEYYDDGHRERIVAERMLAQYLASEGDVDGALPHLEELLLHLDIAMRQSFGFDSERHQLMYMNNVLRPNLDLLAQFCLRNATAHPRVPSMFFEALLHFKGAVANEASRRSAEWGKNKHADELRNDLTVLRERDAAMASRVQDAAVRDERRRIQQRADSLDSALRALDREYDKLRRREDAKWTDVQRQLRADEALIEFAAVPLNGYLAAKADTITYTAVILKRSGDPLIVPLARESAIRPYLEAGTDPSGRSYVSDAARSRELYALLWRPMETHLRDLKRVYLVPDGVLHRVSFPALLAGGEDETQYLDDVLELHFLTGARDLLSRNVRYRPASYRNPQHAVLIGDPSFASGDAPDRNAELEADTDVTRGGTWDELPGTRREVERIMVLLREEGRPCELIVGDEAREERVKELSGNAPLLLHIATHGFFFPVPRADMTHERMTLVTRSGGQQLRVEDNPMLRAGLVFSGVNDVWTGASPASSADDGILSALEISRLDLTGTKLVTLSACETGLGDITNGEGIFGLQRAFQVAGAERILMSLWKVADEPTAEMMQDFYRNWLATGNVDKAFRAARRSMRERYPQPFFWAGFVLVER